MARTSTSSLGYFQNVDGGSSSVGRLQVNVAYKINCGRYDNDLSKYSCVGCPVRLCRWPDNKCDYIENPAVDARGIEGYASRMNYAVVDLPEVNSGSGEMVKEDGTGKRGRIGTKHTAACCFMLMTVFWGL